MTGPSEIQDPPVDDPADDITRFAPISHPPSAPPPVPGEATRVATAEPAAQPPWPTGETSASTISVGSVLSHTYVIEAFLARGGMGEVYRARHQELGSLHAIKVILPELVRDPGVVTMFTEEARKLRRVREDGVVAYEGLSRDEAGRLYLVMEFADGPSLNQVLRERKLTVPEVRLLRDRLARGLGAAHDKGIFHRDLSPDNIILVDGKTELAKVIDFGIAKSSEPGEVTVVGHDFAGKYSWVAPEQLGLFGGQVDARTDIYSLGLVLGAAASGRTLTPCSTMADVITTRQKVPDLTGIPTELRPEIEPLLQPDPAHRPASMATLPRQAAPTVVAAARPLPPKLESAKPKKSNSLVLIGGAAAALTVVGVALVLLLKPGETAAPEPAAAPRQAQLPQVAGPAGLAAVPAARQDAMDVAEKIKPAAAAYDCADIRVTADGTDAVTLDGFVKSSADRDGLASTASTLAGGLNLENRLEVVEWPFCAARRIGPMLGASTGLVLQLDHGNGIYKIGDTFIVKALPPPGIARGWMAVDLIDAAGNVAHMAPAPGQDGAFVADRPIRIGAAKGQPGAWVASDPPGPIMVFGIASDRPLEHPRQPVEDAASYFPWLEQSLRKNGGQLSFSQANATIVKLVSQP